MFIYNSIDRMDSEHGEEYAITILDHCQQVEDSVFLLSVFRNRNRRSEGHIYLVVENVCCHQL